MKTQRAMVFTIPKLFGPLPFDGVQRKLEFRQHVSPIKDAQVESLLHQLKEVVGHYKVFQVAHGNNLVNLQKNKLTDRMIRFDLGVEGFSIDLGVLKHGIRPTAGVRLSWTDKTCEAMQLQLIDDSHQNPSFYYIGFNYSVYEDVAS